MGAQKAERNEGLRIRAKDRLAGEGGHKAGKRGPSGCRARRGNGTTVRLAQQPGRQPRATAQRRRPAAEAVRRQMASSSSVPSGVPRGEDGGVAALRRASSGCPCTRAEWFRSTAPAAASAAAAAAAATRNAASAACAPPLRPCSSGRSLALRGGARRCGAGGRSAGAGSEDEWAGGWAAGAGARRDTSACECTQRCPASLVPPRSAHHAEARHAVGCRRHARRRLLGGVGLHGGEEQHLLGGVGGVGGWAAGHEHSVPGMQRLRASWRGRAAPVGGRSLARRTRHQAASWWVGRRRWGRPSAVAGPRSSQPAGSRSSPSPPARPPP